MEQITNPGLKYILYEIAGREHLLKVGMLKKKIRGGDSLCDLDRFNEILCSLIAEDSAHMLMAPSCSFHLNGGILNMEKKGQYVEDLRAESLNRNVLVFPGSFVWADKGKLYNSTPIIYNGKILFEYYKRTDGGENELGLRYGLEPVFGGKNSGIFAWKDYKLGIELCGDNHEGVLKDDKKVSDLDFHIVLASGRSYLYDQTIIAKPGGYAFLCDGMNPKTEVRQVLEDGRTKQIKPISIKLVD